MSQEPRRALLVIDVQNEYVTGKLRIEHPPIAQSLHHIGLAIDAARAAQIPVAVVQHTAPAASPVFAKGSHEWQLHEVVASRAHEHRIEKSRPSVFHGTDLAEWLARVGADTLSIVGFMTQNCNASTIFEAMHRGLKVEFLSDATGALPYANSAGSVTAEEIHRVFSVVFQSNFAAVADTSRWIAAVQARAPLELDNVVASNQRATRSGGTASP